MTDVEISKALALAIGWKGSDLILNHKCFLYCFEGQEFVGVFDYKDWNVIGPIAERYDCFPRRIVFDGWCTKHRSDFETSPQKAIALAVIGAKK